MRLSRGAGGSVDLIISDLMMPVMDGFQFLEKVKSDDRWRHIPVIMLTAKVNVKTKLRALRIGVDDYLTKPFQEEELKARIANLLNNYRKRMELSSKTGIESSKTSKESRPVIAQVDADWLEDVENIFAIKLADHHFTMEWVALKLTISQRQFIRRLKKLTGLTPTLYLREMRLQTARNLLDQGQYRSVKETSQAVGFADAKYFSNLFQNRFGVPPSFYLR